MTAEVPPERTDETDTASPSAPQEPAMLSAGTRLGRYEIDELIGSGGMGHVYCARDTRLGRAVAIKVLSTPEAADNDALHRLRHEAQATSAINHPNIVAVYDVETDGTPYIVSEYLEGETLRARLLRGPLSVRKALSIAAQVAEGLAAAHRKGIIHRDLKPDNVFITSGGVVKVLDFGLAKLSPTGVTPDSTVAPHTASGVLLGTLGYLSPERISDRPVDHRTDIFSLGIVLYEMLAGARPFDRTSAVSTLSAILTEDAPDLTQVRPGVPRAVARVIRDCLEKKPEDRFQSAADLALSLKALLDDSASFARPRMRDLQRALGWWIAAGVVIATISAAIAMAIPRSPVNPVFRRVTFGRGSISSARFADGGARVIYTAAFSAQGDQVYSTVPGTPESRPLAIAGSEVLAVSPSGQIAVLLNHRLVRGYVPTGTLAVTQEGQAPRELVDGVNWADWSHDGKSLAVVREDGGGARLEFPVDTVLYRTAGWISEPRFSPDGAAIAFVVHPVNNSDEGYVAMNDLRGNTRQLTHKWQTIQGLAWSPTGHEIWFTATDGFSTKALFAVSRTGDERLVLRAPGRLSVLDIDGTGQVLLRRDDVRIESYGWVPGSQRERDISWLDWSLARDLSDDGRWCVMTEAGEAAADSYAVYLRSTDGLPAIRLGNGSAMALAPNGQQVLAISGTRLVLLPVGPGAISTLPTMEMTYLPVAGYFPDGRRVVFTGSVRDEPTRVFVQPLPDGKPRPISPSGFRLTSPRSVSPDGKSVAVAAPDGRLQICDANAASTCRVVAGAVPGEVATGWDRAGQALFVLRESEIPARVFRVRLDGRREMWKTIMPADPLGAVAIHRLLITPDARAYAYSLERQLSELYVVSGIETRRALPDRFRDWIARLFGRGNSAGLALL
jgi:Tol biopolymer transport system component